MMATKLGIEQVVAHGRFEADLAGGKHAGEAREEDAEREVERAQRRTLTPSDETVSRSSVPARMRMPSRV